MSKGFHGNVEVFSGRYVRGWVASRSGKHGSVHVYVNDILRAIVPAVNTRKDLISRGFCEVGGGFDFDLSSFVDWGENFVSLRDPDGVILPKGEKFIDYTESVFGEINYLINSKKKANVNVYGNYYLATDSRSGSVLGKIISLLPINAFNGDGQKDVDCSIWFSHPHLVKPIGVDKLINGKCHNIQKSFIDQKHYEVFNRKVCLQKSELSDDESYVIKSEKNAAHDGKIVLGRELSEVSSDDFVFQKLINNKLDENNVYDIRVPVIGNEIPFVYIKKRPLNIRFSNANTTATITSVHNYLNDKEVSEILKFSRAVGLDYGELDVLRDLDTGDIFVVDVNNTPSGPPNGLTKNEIMYSLREMSLSFYRNFLNDGIYWK